MPDQREDEQWISLADLATEEQRLTFSRFDNSHAWELGKHMVQAAEAVQSPIVVHIRRGGQVLFHAALAGSSTDNHDWVKRKGRLVTRFGHSSLYMGQLCREQSTTLEERFFLSMQEFSPFGGAFPIRVKDVGVVGYVGVSGLPQLEDHRFVTDSIAWHLRVD